MGHYKAGILFALAVLCFANALESLPKDKEVVYKYKALVKAGTTDPESYASEFYLYGKLQLQEEGRNAFIKLSDLKYKVYNGERYYGHEYKIEKQPFPKEAEDILNPFKVIYDDNDQVSKIVTDKNEKTFARNMHKAIAAILQAKKEAFEGDEPKAFVTKEQSIYGYTTASYNVVPSSDKIVIKKMHEMKSTRPLYHAIVTKANPEYCEATYEEPMSHDSQQLYIVSKKQKYTVADYIQSTGGVYIYPFQTKSEFQYVKINITLELEGIVPIQKHLEVNNPRVDNNLVYQTIDPSVEPTPLYDIMNGRRVADVKKFVPIVETLLTEMEQHLHKNPFHTNTPNIEHGQLVNRIVRLLTFFDKETLEQTYETIRGRNTDKDKDRIKLLNQLLPLVGTHASAVVVKNIIHEKKVENNVAIHMLENLPGHINVPTEQILHEMEDILTWGDEIDVYVRHAAILTFASLIHKTFYFQVSVQHNIRELQHPRHHGPSEGLVHLNLHVGPMYHYYKYTDEVAYIAKQHDIYNKYVKNFFNKVQSAQDYRIKNLYLNALQNTRLPSVVDYLLPIVKGEVKTDPKTRYTALWAISPMVLGDSEKVFEIYWPIFSNWSERLEIRALAYTLIMDSHPPISRLLNIHWQMSSEPDTELRHYYYSYLKSVADSTDPCIKVFSLNAAQILKLTRKPNYHGYSITNRAEYLDRKFGFGGDLQTTVFNANDTKIFSLRINSQLFNVRSNNYKVLIKVSGLSDELYDNFHLNLDSQNQLFSYGRAWNFYKSIVDNKEVSVQITVGSNGRIAQTYHFEGEHLKDLKDIFSLFYQDEFAQVYRSIYIYYDIFTKIVLPTDIGIPAMLEILMPVVNHKHINTKKEVKNNLVNFHLNNKYRIARHTRYGLSFYNPVADVWQGVNRYISFDAQIPVYADITINPQQNTVKISIKREENQEENIFGIRSHSATMTFLKDDLDLGVLEQSCPQCKRFTIVTKADEYRHNYTLYNAEGYNTGSNYQLVVYDSEYPQHNKDIYYTIRRFTDTDTKQFSNPISYIYTVIRHFHAFSIYKPRTGPNGFLITVSPSKQQPVTQIDFTFRINREYIHEKDQFLPGVKFNTRFTWVLKNKEKSVKTWDVNANIDLNPGQTIRNTKIDVTRIIPGQKDYKVCTEYTKKWTKDSVNGHFIGVMGKSTDGKCDKDGAKIEVNMIGNQLEEQKSPHHGYEICDPYEHDLQPDYNSLECAAQHASIRKYIYDIKTSNNMPTEFKKIFYSLINKFKVLYSYESKFEDEIEGKVTEENQFKIKVEYPIDLQRDEINMEFITPSYAYEFSGIPLNRLSYFGFYPDNIRYSKLFMIMHQVGMFHTFIVYPDKIQHEVSERKQVVPFEIPNEWTLYVGDAEKDCRDAIYLKKIQNNLIALKAIHGSEVVEIYPEGDHGENFKVVINGKELSKAVDFHTEKWFSLLVRPHVHSVILNNSQFRLHIEYKGDKVIIQVPKVHGYKFYGKCFYRNY